MERPIVQKQAGASRWGGLLAHRCGPRAAGAARSSWRPRRGPSSPHPARTLDTLDPVARGSQPLFSHASPIGDLSYTAGAASGSATPASSHRRLRQCSPSTATRDRTASRARRSQLLRHRRSTSPPALLHRASSTRTPSRSTSTATSTARDDLFTAERLYADVAIDGCRQRPNRHLPDPGRPLERHRMPPRWCGRRRAR